MKDTIAMVALSFAAVTSALADKVDKVSALAVTLAVTATVNNPNTTPAGNVTTYPAPSTKKLATKDLLALLATDKYAERKYNSLAFPSGAKLVFMLDNDDLPKSYFIVTDSKGTNLVDVSDLLTATIHTDNLVTSGKTNVVTGLQTGIVRLGGAEIDFDDTGIGGETVFTLAGVAKSSINDSPGKSGVTYSETETVTINPAIGTGEVNGNPAVVSGSITFTGTKVFSF